MLKPEERTRLAQNIAGHVKDAKKMIQERLVGTPEEHCVDKPCKRIKTYS